LSGTQKPSLTGQNTRLELQNFSIDIETADLGQMQH